MRYSHTTARADRVSSSKFVMACYDADIEAGLIAMSRPLDIHNKCMANSRHAKKGKNPI